MSRHLVDIKMIRESLSAMILALIADSIAGYIMDRSVAVFVAIPGLLMMIPALIDMRGNIYGAFISRLSSALHLGEVKNIKDRRVKEDIITTKSLAYSSAITIGIIVGAWISFTMDNYFYLLFLPSIILVTHLFTASILTPLTAYIGVKTYQKGWNPDNVGVPLISSAGDLVSVFFIILTALALLEIKNYPFLLGIIVLSLLLYVGLLIRGTFKDGRTGKIYIQSMPVLISIALLELLTGSMWEANKIAILLLVLPPINESLGNIGSVFSSRLSSFIYLGLVEPEIIPKGRHFLREVVSLFILSAIVFSIISLFAISVSFDIRILPVIWLSAAISVVILLILAYYLTVGSLKLKLDPDNIVVPVITTLADVIGSAMIILSYMLLF